MFEVPSLSLTFEILWQITKNWWWLFLPFILLQLFLYFWLWWRRERWLTAFYKTIVLEVKIPKEILKPIRAMENVMEALHGVVYHPPDNWEKWIDGQLQTGLSFETVSLGGEIHFFIRFFNIYRDGIEAAIYSQYPEAEIREVEDYSKLVPQDIPNKDWDLFATDYFLDRPDPYPIKTYPKFETEQEKEPEKIVDPIANLLEGFAKIKPGEQFWIQIRASPISQEFVKPFIKEGEKIRDEIAKRPPGEKAKPKSIIEEALEILITGKPKEEKAPEPEFIAPELRMTPGEREVVAGIENKISKPAFSCGIRFIYLGKREVWFKQNFRLAFNFFNCYVTANMNAPHPWGNTLTKIKKSIWFPPINLIRDRRSYLRRRKIFRNYRMRENPLFPRFTKRDKGSFILNTEELASLFHFPSWRVAPVPGLSRVESKKGPPSGLPVE